MTRKSFYFQANTKGTNIQYIRYTETADRDYMLTASGVSRGTDFKE